MNFVTVVVYWTCMHWQCIGDFKPGMEQFHMVWVHSAPALMTYVNWTQCDIVLAGSHAKGLTMVGVLYSCFNCVQTWIDGSPTYPFLPWNNWQSPCYCIALLAFFNICYI